MDIQAIADVLKNKRVHPEGRYYTFGVLVPLLKIQNRLHLIFEVRAGTLNNQPGEISFPGGRMEEGEMPARTAVRETSEELLIPAACIDIIGQLDYIVTPFNYLIYPYAGMINGVDFSRLKGNPSEVEEIFAVPLSYFMNMQPVCGYVKVQMVPSEGFPFELIPDGTEYKWKEGLYPVYFYQYNKYIIWGITARILRNFIDKQEGISKNSFD